MKQRWQRIGLILLMVAALAYTIFNYVNGRTGAAEVLVIGAFMGWLIMGQTAALIREWKEE